MHYDVEFQTGYYFSFCFPLTTTSSHLDDGKNCECVALSAENVVGANRKKVTNQTFCKCHMMLRKRIWTIFLCVVVVVAVSLCDDEQRPQSRMFSSSIWIRVQHVHMYVRMFAQAELEGIMLTHSTLTFVMYFVQRVCIRFIVLSILRERNKHCTVDWRRDPYSILNTLCHIISYHITPPPHTLSTALISFCTVQSQNC